jgi:glycosyltransferase involved in cell wall biosynthesis
MQVSLTIPTYKRVKDLDECLDSVIAQTKLPKEMIIVDDSYSENDEVENLIDCRKDEFKEKGVHSRCAKNERERSLTIARDARIENALGDIVLFLDSNVVLDVNYIEENLRVYREKPEAMGVQGFIQGVKKRKDKSFVYFQ